MKIIITLIALTGFLLSVSSCAYHDTMNERNAEGVSLQNELNLEIEKERKLR